MEQNAQQMGPIGGMDADAMFDQDMLMEPLNDAID